MFGDVYRVFYTISYYVYCCILCMGKHGRNMSMLYIQDVQKMVGEDIQLTAKCKADLSRPSPFKDSLVSHIHRVNHRLTSYRLAHGPFSGDPTHMILTEAGQILKRMALSQYGHWGKD